MTSACAALTPSPQNRVTRRADFSASLIFPDWGLKNISSRNTADQSPASDSLPDSPSRDWLRLFGVTAVIEPLLFGWMIDSVPAGK